MYNEDEPDRYLLVEDIVLVDGRTYRSYGIVQAHAEAGHREEYRDIGTDRSSVKALVKRCNELRLDPIHLKDVVEDFITSL